ncbi:hypothetical protein [Streptomyces sparsogenes]|uniref:hypothetical protein n=1 Tax=Streptomyces sparsogenes TaxID=67365 RepID=UPI0008260065|nr:hypothetical protein [Streptomyces sparsogenes]
MGRHSRPTPAQQARATTIKAAAALGVAGTIALALHSSIGSDKTVQARADVSSQPDGTPEAGPGGSDRSTGSDRPTGPGRSTDADRPGGTGPAPTASAKPKLVRDADGASRADTSHTREPSGTPTAGTPSTAPTSDPGAEAPSASEPDTTEPTSPAEDPTTHPADPGHESGGHHDTGQGRDKDHGLVGGVIDGVGDTVDGVLGGLTGGLLGG